MKNDEGDGKYQRKGTGRRNGGRERQIANRRFLQRLIIIVNFAWKIESRLDCKVEQFFRFCFGHPSSSFLRETSRGRRKKEREKKRKRKESFARLKRGLLKRLKDIWQTGRLFLLRASFETCFSVLSQINPRSHFVFGSLWRYN